MTQRLPLFIAISVLAPTSMLFGCGPSTSGPGGPPIVFTDGPNLAVSGLSFDSPAAVGDTLSITVTIMNTGTVPLESTYTVRFSDDAVMSTDDIIVGYGTASGLYPRDTDVTTISWDIPTNFAGGTYHLGVVMAEAAGGEELVDDNVLVYELVLDGPACAEDVHEEDDSIADAVIVAPYTAYEGNFCRDASDWIAIEVVAGAMVLLVDYDDAPRIPVNFDLYDANGDLIVETFPESPSPYQPWVAPATGTYYARIHPASQELMGPNSSYRIAFSDERPDLYAGYGPNYDSPLHLGAGEVFASVYPYAIEWMKEGFPAVGPHSVDLYLSPDETIDASDIFIRRVRVDDPAAAVVSYPGILPERMTVDIEWYVPHDLADGTYYLGIVVDSLDEVAEIVNINNSGAKEQVIVEAQSTCTVDSYEDDDLPELATLLETGVPQTHNICDDERDWAFVDLEAGEAFHARVTDFDPANPAWGTGLLGVKLSLVENGDLANPVAEGPGITFVAPSAGRYEIVASRGGYYGYDDGPSSTDETYVIERVEPLPDIHLLVADTLQPNAGFCTSPCTFQMIIESRNDGGTVAPNFVYRVMLSQDSSPSPDDVLLHQYTTNGSGLPWSGWGDRISTISISTTLSNTGAQAWPAGTYYLITALDPDDAIAEIDETNNFIVQVVQKP